MAGPNTLSGATAARALDTTTTGNLDQFEPHFIAAGRFTLEEAGILDKLFSKETLPRGQGRDISIPKFGTVTAYALTEGVDMAQAQSLSDSVTTITPGEVGVQVVVTDKMLRQLPAGLAEKIGRVMGNAMMVKRESDLMTLLDGFSVANGGTGAALNVEELFIGYSNIRGNVTEPGPEPIYCVLHPWQWYDIAADIEGFSAKTFGTGTPLEGAGGITEQVFKDFFVGRIASMPIMISGNVPIDSTPDATGGCFSRESCIFVEVEGVSNEKERDASLRGWEYNVTAEYGYVEYQNAWGFELKSDATAPT